MRKPLYLTVILLLVLGIGAAAYWMYVYALYPEHVVTKFVNSTDHQTVAKRHSSHDWYIRAAIRPDDGEAAMRRYAFREGYSPEMLDGKIDESHIVACQVCWSYVESKGHGPYGYRLVVIGAEKKDLQMYELFGD